MRGSQERYGRPLCRAHIPGHGVDAVEIVPWHLYAPYFTPAEQAALHHLLHTLAREDALTGEIQTARVMLLRLLAHIAALGELTTGQIVRLTPLVLQTAEAIARLLKAQQALNQGGPDPSELILDDALRQLSDLWDVDLLGDGSDPP
jgi:hypothetical protein